VGDVERVPREKWIISAILGGCDFIIRRGEEKSEREGGGGAKSMPGGSEIYVTCPSEREKGKSTLQCIV